MIKIERNDHQLTITNIEFSHQYQDVKERKKYLYIEWISILILIAIAIAFQFITGFREIITNYIDKKTYYFLLLIGFSTIILFFMSKIEFESKLLNMVIDKNRKNITLTFINLIFLKKEQTVINFSNIRMVGVLNDEERLHTEKYKMFGIFFKSGRRLAVELQCDDVQVNRVVKEVREFMD